MIQRYEYNKISAEVGVDDVLKKLDEAGERGWKMVSSSTQVFGTRVCHIFFFIRAIGGA